MTSFSLPQRLLGGNAVGAGPLFGRADAGIVSVTSCQVVSPPTTGPGAPTDVATKVARPATKPSSSTKLPMPP